MRTTDNGSRAESPIDGDDLSIRTHAVLEETRALLQESRYLAGLLRIENEKLSDAAGVLRATHARFKEQLCKLIQHNGSHDEVEILKAVEHRIAASDGHNSHVVRSITERLGYNYNQFLMVVENYEGTHDATTRIMREILLNLMSPIVARNLTLVKSANR